VSAHDYKENVTDHKIDYIFTSESLAKEADQVKIWDENSHGIFLSDHYPISAVLSFDDI
jgi:endonuclease/exonuclease/phosphatase family metal-dependent hydrolase